LAADPMCDASEEQRLETIRTIFGASLASISTNKLTPYKPIDLQPRTSCDAVDERGQDEITLVNQCMKELVGHLDFIHHKIRTMFIPHVKNMGTYRVIPNKTNQCCDFRASTQYADQ
jgi:hypothetical protein